MLTATDSTTTVTDAKGSFVFLAVKVGQFSLVIQSIGYEPVKRRFVLDNTNEPVFLKPVISKASTTILNGVTITDVLPVKIKEDTVEFNAGAYKVRDGAPVEDVIKKTPGADVDKDGNITFRGKSVTKVRVTIPFNLGIGAYGDHLGAMIPTNEFFNSYETGDLRAQERQFYFSNYPQYGDTTKNIVFGEHALYKYFHLESALGNGQSDENWTFFRLPEAMLIFAEATNEVSGPTTDANAQVNLIRQRAKLVPLSGLSKDSFRIAIWKERYHELAYEDKAYFDVQRTHQTYDPIHNTFGDATTTPTEQGVIFKSQYYLWPIPQREISTNSKLTQNPGW